MVSIAEDLKKQHIDWDVAIAEVSDNALGAGVELGGNNDDLMALIDALFVDCLAVFVLEGFGQAFATGELLKDAGDCFGCQCFDPAGIVQGLRHHISWRSVSFQFNQHNSFLFD